jgi:hypothetical protein
MIVNGLMLQIEGYCSCFSHDNSVVHRENGTFVRIVDFLAVEVCRCGFEKRTCGGATEGVALVKPLTVLTVFLLTTPFKQD